MRLSSKAVKPGNDIIPPGNFPGLSPAKAMAELGVCKLMQSSGSTDTEVAPHVLAAAEVQLLHCATARPETLGKMENALNTGFITN